MGTGSGRCGSPRLRRLRACICVGDLSTGAAYVERALMLNPGYAPTLLISGWIHIWLGQPDVAIDHVQRALRLNPLGPHTAGMQMVTAIAHYIAGRYDEAYLWVSKALHERPDLAPYLRLAAASAAMAGNPAEAARLCARLQRIDPGLRISNLGETQGPFANWSISTDLRRACARRIARMTEQRRLAAILVADVVGYSKLVGSDEAGTLARSQTLRTNVIEPAISQARGPAVQGSRRRLPGRVRQCRAGGGGGAGNPAGQRGGSTAAAHRHPCRRRRRAGRRSDG